MWILCAGMPFSGAERHYAIATALVRRAGLGDGIGVLPTADLADRIDEAVVGAPWRVAQVTGFVSALSRRLWSRDIKALYAYRDVRDVYAAMVKADSPEASGGAKRVARLLVARYEQWVRERGVCVARMPELQMDVAEQVRRVASHLGLPIRDDLAVTLAGRLTPFDAGVPPGAFKRCLDANTVRAIEKQAGTWLKARGYPRHTTAKRGLRLPWR